MLSLPPQIFIPRIFHPYFLPRYAYFRVRAYGLIEPTRHEFSNPSRFALRCTRPRQSWRKTLVVADVFSYRLGGTREKTDPIFLTFAQIYLTVLASFSVPSFARAKRPKFGETSKYFAGNNVWRNITFEERKRFLFSISSTRYPSAERGIRQKWKI